MSHGRRGGGRHSGAGGAKVDLIPTVPPLYPVCSPPEALDENLSKYAPKYNEMVQYMISNYRIDRVNNPDTPSAFVVERYSDCYSAPLKLDKSLMHSLDPRRIPQELGPKSGKKVVKSSQKNAEMRAKIALDKLAKLPDQDAETLDSKEEKEENDENEEPSAKKIKTEGNEDDDEKAASQDEENEEEMDEELDEGTDYMSNYFDNGEGFGDSDEDNLDDSSVY